MNVLLICFIFFLAVILAFLIVDAYIYLYEWQSRIHIGRWSDRKVWRCAVEQKARQWLKKSPTVRTSNNTRLLLWDILRGEFRNKTVQSWQDAGLLLGLGEKACHDYVMSHPDLFKKNLDTDFALLAYALKVNNSLSNDQEANVLSYFKKYIDDKVVIPYKQKVATVLFVDTIGLVVPFLYSVGEFDAAVRQVKEYDKALLRDTFPAHSYNLQTDYPQGLHDWARGIGWYVWGLTVSADLADHSTRIVRIADALLPLQKDNGGFGRFIFNRSGRAESSGTVMIGLLMNKAYSLTRNNKYLECAIRIEHFLMSITRRDGAVDYNQGDTPCTGYYSYIFSIMPFAQGMTLLFSKQLDDYLK